MYQFSLEFYVRIFKKSIKLAEKVNITSIIVFFFLLIDAASVLRCLDTRECHLFLLILLLFFYSAHSKEDRGPCEEFDRKFKKMCVL